MTNSLFEKYILCDEGFGNIYDRDHPDDPPIGFRLRIRVPYYRSVRLSLIDKITVKVDGKEYDPSKFRFTTHDGTFTMDEMRTMPNHYWLFGEKATVTVMEPDGLGRAFTTAFRTVEIGIYLRIAYSHLGFIGIAKKELKVGS